MCGQPHRKLSLFEPQPKERTGNQGRPAFLLTRPTDNGRNEETALPPPSSPPSSSPLGREQLSESPATLTEQVRCKEEIVPGRSITKITTLLPDIEHFSTSPVAVTATSPRTRAFFDAGLVEAVRSPPRPGGAIITEIASDTEFTIVEAKTRHCAAGAADARDAAAAQAHGHRQELGIEEPLEKRAGSRSRSGERFEPSGQSARHSVRLPYVIGRTVVSTDVPRLMRAASLRQQRLRDYDRQLEMERQREKLRILAQREKQRERERERERKRERERERERECERARLARAAAVQFRQQEEARQQRVRSQCLDPPAKHDSPLQALIIELKAGLEADPAVYYAVRGVLHEYEEHTGRVPAKASSVDEPSDRTKMLKQRAREANRQERFDEVSRDKHRRLPQVSFDDDTSATERERPRTLPQGK